ncbi:MAG TPA: OsmC family protein [Ignavibacteria bacterium]|nr:OsmC family protein [Ignavibacteria bacterium]
MEITLEDKKKVIAKFGNYKVITDQPVEAGGEATAPSPFEMFLVSIGTCAGIFVKSFCDQRGIPSKDIKIIETFNYNPETHLIGKIKLEIQLPPDFPEKYKSAVISSANLCTVKKHLASPPEIEVTADIK